MTNIYRATNFFDLVFRSDYPRGKLGIISSISVIIFLVSLTDTIIFADSSVVRYVNHNFGKEEKVLGNFPTASLGRGDDNYISG